MEFESQKTLRQKKKDNTSRLRVFLDEEDCEELKKIAIELNTSCSEIVRVLIDKYIEEQEKKL